MRFPSRTLSGLSTATPDQWQAFAVVDILQLVAVTLTLLQVAIWLAGTRARLMWWSLGRGGGRRHRGAALVARVVVGDRLPLFLRAYLTAETGSLFPALPWAAYVFFGAGLGLWYVRQDAAVRATAGAHDLPQDWVAPMIVAGVLLHQLPWAPFGDVYFWTISPNLFLVKAGSVLVGRRRRHPADPPR